MNDIVGRFSAWADANKGVIATRIDKFFSFIVWSAQNLAPPILGAVVAFNAIKYSMIAAAAAGKIFSVVNTIMFAFQSVAGGAATAQEALNMVMAANPVGLIITAIAVVIGLFTLLATKVGGVGNAFKVVGQTLMKFFVMPLNLVIDSIQMAIGLLSLIHGVGDKLAGVNEKISSFQAMTNKTLTGSESAYNITDPYKNARSEYLSSREAPNQAQVDRQDSTFQGDLYFHNAPSGTTMETKSTGPASLRYELMGAN